ncbi:hypothetical protein BC829DRAFT_414523 [Chytridium lagenaria]|nr:hypothetical protein BC829DRAFT_414523 [Chytridium lagenaria]
MGEALPAASAAPQPAGRPLHGPRSFHGIHTIHHSQFTRQDKLDTSLPQHVKQIIIDGSAVRYHAYEPEKVFVRTDHRYAIRDSKQIALDKSRRRTGCLSVWFLFGCQEPYRALGEPIIDSDALLYTCLKLDAGSFQRNTNSKVAETTSKSNEISTSTRKYRLGASIKDGNGFGAIKNKLAKSKQRLHAVKGWAYGFTQFGIPFVQMCEDLDKENGLNRPQAGPDGDSAHSLFKHSIGANLKVDHDKQSYFINLLENRRDQSAEADRGCIASSETRQPGRDHENFFAVRDQFYEQRQRLTQILNEDLDRLDFDRKAEFIAKVPRLPFRVLRQHPWYYELLNKVQTSSVNGLLKEMEQLLLDRIRCIIEDGRPFTQSVFVQLMRLIPQTEFMNDEIQRIIRFVRVNENINEREYVEAVEMANHMIV